MALNTNLAAAAGVLGAVVTSWIVVKKPDLSMMLNGAIAALVAITAACAFVTPWAAILIGFVSGIIVVARLAARRADRPRRSRRRDRGPRHVGHLGHACRSASSPCPHWRTSSQTGGGGLFYGGGFHQLGIQALGLLAVGAFTFTASFLILLLFKVTFGIRTEPEVEEWASTSPSTACGGTPSSTFRFPAATARSSRSTGKHFSDREVIVPQGSSGDSMYVVQSGKVEVVHTARPAKTSSLRTLKAGEFFGEMAIFEDEVRSATVRAVGDTRRPRGGQEDRARSGSRTTRGWPSTC